MVPAHQVARQDQQYDWMRLAIPPQMTLAPACARRTLADEELQRVSFASAEISHLILGYFSAVELSEGSRLRCRAYVHCL